MKRTLALVLLLAACCPEPGPVKLCEELGYESHDDWCEVTPACFISPGVPTDVRSLDCHCGDVWYAGRAVKGEACGVWVVETVEQTCYLSFADCHAE